MGCRVFKVTKPDLSDNLNKMVFDAMNNLVFKDDSQIVLMENVRKFYGLTPKIIIYLEEL